MDTNGEVKWGSPCLRGLPYTVCEGSPKVRIEQPVPTSRQAFLAFYLHWAVVGGVRNGVRVQVPFSTAKSQI